MGKWCLYITLLFFSPAAFSMTFWDHAKYTFSDAFDSTGLEILAVGTAVTLIAFSQDQAMHDAWVGNQRISPDASSVGNFWGKGYVEAGIALAQLFFDTENGIVDVEGLASSTLVTQGIKYGAQRVRPDSTEATSFPSGHTQISFASATSLNQSYGLWVGIPMFAMATFTGLTRLADNAHWLSDTTAGATIGILFGRAGFKHHFSLRSMTINDGGRGAGVVVQWRY